jgi:hypothetical protein
MRLQNYTDIDSELIREIVRFVKPNGVSKFDLSIKNCKYSGRGRAYSQGCSYHDTAAPLVIVSIGSADKFPVAWRDLAGGYLPMEFYNRVEALVAITAHELRHLWQAQHPKGWRVWGARGQFSERDADAYALHMLRLWRRAAHTAAR